MKYAPDDEYTQLKMTTRRRRGVRKENITTLCAGWGQSHTQHKTGITHIHFAIICPVVFVFPRKCVSFDLLREQKKDNAPGINTFIYGFTMCTEINSIHIENNSQKKTHTHTNLQPKTTDRNTKWLDVNLVRCLTQWWYYPNYFAQLRYLIVIDRCLCVDWKNPPAYVIQSRRKTLFVSNLIK